jgi:hypothetical protein
MQREDAGRIFEGRLIGTFICAVCVAGLQRVLSEEGNSVAPLPPAVSFSGYVAGVPEDRVIKALADAFTPMVGAAAMLLISAFRSHVPGRPKVIFRLASPDTEKQRDGS